MSNRNLVTRAVIIREQGAGYPDVGAYVPGLDSLWRVVSTGSTIHTAGPGLGNYIYATVEAADWDDCEDSDVFAARVEDEPCDRRHAEVLELGSSEAGTEGER